MNKEILTESFALATSRHSSTSLCIDDRRHVGKVAGGNLWPRREKARGKELHLRMSTLELEKGRLSANFINESQCRC
jgi:hypothetical protein